MKYEKSKLDTAIRQGELLSNVVEVVIDIRTIGSDETKFSKKTHPFAFVVSQDCDLDWDFHARQTQTQEHKKLPNILFCQAMAASDLARLVFQIYNVTNTKKTPWKRIRQNK